jgi:two-component system, NtrC family, C4-dicarboxylate transport sensor histidine kinase DctB
MTDPNEPAPTVTTDRAFSTADLAYINRMTTTGMVLPSVAHEVNNSLQVIAGMVEILGLRGQLPPEVSDKVQKIAVQATKAAGHLRELVAFARRDGVSPKVELKAAVERAVSLRRYYLTRGRVAVTIDVPAEESFVVRADSQHVIQVLVNLVINAEESVAKQDVRTVRIRTWRDGGSVNVEFVDSGSGFDAPMASRVGEPFVTSKSTGAAGLGLAVAKRLVEADGGRLTIAPTPAVVTVSWPDAPA